MLLSGRVITKYYDKRENTHLNARYCVIILLGLKCKTKKTTTTTTTKSELKYLNNNKIQ